MGTENIGGNLNGIPEVVSPEVVSKGKEKLRLKPKVAESTKAQKSPETTPAPHDRLAEVIKDDSKLFSDENADEQEKIEASEVKRQEDYRKVRQELGLGDKIDGSNVKTRKERSSEMRESQPFDPEKEITDEDWKNMAAELKKLRGFLGDLKAFAKQAMAMKILNPDEDFDLDKRSLLGLGRSTWGSLMTDMKEEIKNTKESIEENKKAGEKGMGYWEFFAEEAMAMKIIEPSRDLKLDSTVEQGMKDQLQKIDVQIQADEFANLVMAIKILHPSIDLGKDLKLYDQGEYVEHFIGSGGHYMKSKWSYMLEELKYRRENSNISPDNQLYFPSIAMSMKILGASDRDLNLSVDAWKFMREQLEAYRKKGDWWNFTQQAMAMKILASEKVEVTDKGLEVIMSEKE